ncbi:mannose-6-phosphate isomerase, class I [Saccharomonospora saliphila]|uniref:mannose-6-phosphate isomerase, class I n=1 Tax=Saccharomonospora saliphila TaxID=369829 RepID=UPI0003657F79|nr:mannose-6-phosphate isomerase, class I [Saccharomonospora saliphila]
MTVELLRNAVRPYAWGSRTTIPELLGRPVPAPHPEAELWMGAHPGDPSYVVDAHGDERSLLDVVEDDPEGQLGARCARHWGGRLPFLLKILAVEEPLSMQAHPSAEQAAEGWAREERAGIPRDAADRNYPDPTAKPELVCALTEFHALAGFRDPWHTVRLLRAIDTPGLTKYTELLAAQPDPDGLRTLFTTWITLPQPTLDRLLPEVLDACVRHIKERGEFDAECRTVLELGEAHPHDAGVLAALLLNRLTLHAGDALYLPAGNLHLYLHGTAVEILANSDNILRCGLTPKHVDVPELLRVVDFACGDMPVLTGERADHDERVAVYRTGAPEFELSRVEWGEDDRAEVRLGGAGPEILLCTSGELLLCSDDGTKVELRRGESVWLPACDPPVGLRPVGEAPARLFRATAGTCA